MEEGLRIKKGVYEICRITWKSKDFLDCFVLYLASKKVYLLIVKMISVKIKDNIINKLGSHSGLVDLPMTSQAEDPRFEQWLAPSFPKIYERNYICLPRLQTYSNFKFPIHTGTLLALHTQPANFERMLLPSSGIYIIFFFTAS